jgi:hypothetical protein
MKDFKINIHDSDWQWGGQKYFGNLDVRLREAGDRNIRQIFDYLGTSLESRRQVMPMDAVDLPNTPNISSHYERRVQFFKENPFAIIAWFDSYGDGFSLFTNFAVRDREDKYRWSGVSSEADATTLSYDMIRVLKGYDKEEWKRSYNNEFEDEYREGIEFLPVGNGYALGSEVPSHPGIGIASITSKNWYDISYLFPNHETRYNVGHQFINWATLPKRSK